MNIFDMEDRATIPVGTPEVDLDGQAFTAEENVSQTAVLHLRDASLLVVIECDIAHVRLNLAEGEGEVVAVLVRDGVIWRELDEVVRFERDDVGEKILALESEVLNDQIESVVGVFDARDRDVTDLVDDSWQDNSANISPQMRFELQISLRVKQEILG